MLPDRVSNPGPLTYESGALPIALRGPAIYLISFSMKVCCFVSIRIPHRSDSNEYTQYTIFNIE